jgi:cell division septum initiation protein DivIVA
MENKELFQKAPNGYNCEQVEQYINVLKTEYKKVFEYAKATEANNEKLKKICRSLSDENKALKASGSAPVDNSVLLNSVKRIIELSEEITAEKNNLGAYLTK